MPEIAERYPVISPHMIDPSGSIIKAAMVHTTHSDAPWKGTEATNQLVEAAHNAAGDAREDAERDDEDEGVPMVCALPASVRGASRVTRLKEITREQINYRRTGKHSNICIRFLG
jgi:hypothetical protein